MFSVFSTAESLITAKLIHFAVFPISILSAGIATIAASALILWFIYKSYMVMAGLISDPLPTILADTFKKVAIIAFAASLSGLYTYLVHPFMEIQESLASDFSGGQSTSIFANIERHITEVAVLFEASTGMDEERPSNLEIKTEENGEPLGFFEWAWVSIGDAWDKVETAAENVGDVWSLFMITLSVAAVMAGLMIMGIAAFMPIILNKMFFMLGLGFAPLFIMFLAFDSTKGWFHSWLNSTIGYCLSYPLAMMVVSVLLSIYSQLYNQESLNYINAAVCLVTSLIFAIIIARIGDVASNWFSAQNISDTTSAAAAIFMGNTYRRMTKTGKTTSKGIGVGASSFVNVSWGLSKGTYGIGKAMSAGFRRTKVSKGEKE